MKNLKIIFGIICIVILFSASLFTGGEKQLRKDDHAKATKEHVNSLHGVGADRTL